MQPKISFKVDKEKDFLSYKAFLNDAEYNKLILDWAFFNKHPNLKNSIKESDGHFIGNDNSIKKFINEYYSNNLNSIKSNMKEYERIWNTKKDEYFKLVSELFSNDYWPKGEYVAYSTIWGLFPRFLEEKSFQIPAIYEKKDYIQVIIAHEMLHFIFYNYFLKNYPKYNMEGDDFFIWHISEIFNSIIQNSKSWLNEFKTEAQTYPEHDKIIENLEKKYKNSSNFETKELIEDILSEVKKNPNLYSFEN
ncbi:MAG: hypothetical protein WCX74_02035 [Candidatus Paceibacterota bacterium]